MSVPEETPADVTKRPSSTQRETLSQSTRGPNDVTQANTIGTGVPDPAQVGWDTHFGWGRVDLGKAVSLAEGGIGRFFSRLIRWHDKHFGQMT